MGDLTDEKFIEQAYKDWTRMSKREKKRCGSTFGDYVSLLLKTKAVARALEPDGKISVERSAD